LSQPRVLGIVGNRSTPDTVEIVSRKPLPLGTYIAIEFEFEDPVTERRLKHVLIGVVSSTSFRRTVPVSGAAALSSSRVYAEYEEELGRYGSSYARIFADIVDGEVHTPRTPPPPGAQVFLAPASHLQRLFSRGGEDTVRIGHLVGRPDVEVRVSIDALAKHLFITGTTGSGKSNTVAILIDRLASVGGTAIVFDVHGEYANLVPENSGVEVRTIDLYINPLRIPPRALARMIVPEASATVQRRLVANAIREAQRVFSRAIEAHGVTKRAVEEVSRELNQRGKGLSSDSSSGEGSEDPRTELVELFKRFVVQRIALSKGRGVGEKSVESAVMKVEEFFEFTPIDFAQPSPIDVLKPRRVVVLNASALDDEQRDYMMKLVADELLWYSKHWSAMGRPRPVILVIEEAHLFLSTSRETHSRRSIERLAREGRKFGVCLFIVSQRPRNIDTNTVSQVQNFVFMKLVQEADQEAVMNVSDTLTDDLARSLSSMDTGEAIVLGEWIGRYPAFAKIDKHGGKLVGATPSISALWRSASLEEERGDRLADIHEAALEDLRGLI